MDEWFECNVTQKYRTMPKLKTKLMGADAERKRAKKEPPMIVNIKETK